MGHHLKRICWNYEKAVSLKIDECSRHYTAFKEIERRYVALYFAVEFCEDILSHLTGENSEAMVKGYVLMIVKELFIGEIICDENGKKEYIPQRITIKKSNTQAIEAHQAAKDAVIRLQEIDFTRTDYEQFASEIREDVFYMISWFMIAREFIFPVKVQRKADCA